MNPLTIVEASIDRSPALADWMGQRARIYRYVLSLVHDPTEAEDLTQEALLRAFQHQDALRTPEAATAWLYRIATHVSLDRLRQRVRRAPLEADADPDDLDVADGDSLSLQQLVEQDEMGACVQRYLTRLSDRYRAVILLHDMHDVTAAEIAVLLGISLANVKIHLHRARQKLKASLSTGCAFDYDERGVLTCESRAVPAR
jgi:RNA polymerase sigma-70 factor, ECF subfamily